MCSIGWKGLVLIELDGGIGGFPYYLTYVEIVCSKNSRTILWSEMTLEYISRKASKVPGVYYQTWKTSLGFLVFRDFHWGQRLMHETPLAHPHSWWTATAHSPGPREVSCQVTLTSYWLDGTGHLTRMQSNHWPFNNLLCGRLKENHWPGPIGFSCMTV